MDKVGKDGTITVEEAKSIETTLEVWKVCSSTKAISPPIRDKRGEHGSDS
jgi:hypothetical protein